MMHRNERMEKLNAAGINTGKYFNLNLPEGLKPGATISLVISENGEPVIVGGGNGPKAIDSMMRFKEEFSKTDEPNRPWSGLGPNFDALEANYRLDQIRNQIIADGYVRNTKLHRRFVMAQMFHMLNYVSYNGRESGYTACLRNNFDYKYTLDMMIEEVNVLGKLESRDKESFMERSHFFTKEVVVAVLNDYLEKLKKYVDSLPDKNCKGVPYKTVKGVHIFNADLDKKLYRPIRDRIARVQRAGNYEQMYRELMAFMRYSFVKLPHRTPKSKAWIDAYKGEGAYYTLKNLIMFHDCGIKVDRFDVKFGVEAMAVLKSKLDEYKGEGWRMFALMKKVIEDNNFDFNKRMKELGK